MCDQAKEPCQKKYEAVKTQHDRDTAIFLTNGGTKEKGTAAQRKETLQLKESKKASKDKYAPKRPAGGAFGQLLAGEAGGDQEESVGGPQDHRRDQESW